MANLIQLERRRANDRRYYHNNREKIIKRKRDWQRKAKKRHHYSILEKLGGLCKKCGYLDYRALQIDHIKGGGIKELRHYRGRYIYYRDLDKLPLDILTFKYQLLCANCNWIKKYESIIRGVSTSAKKARIMRSQIIEKLGSECRKCTFSDYRALQIDHIHGGGTKEINDFSGRYGYYKYILSFSDEVLRDNYQTLCANCNWIKRSDLIELTHPGVGLAEIGVKPIG